MLKKKAFKSLIFGLILSLLHSTIAAYALTRGEAEINSRKVSGSHVYSLYAAESSVKILGFLGGDIDRFHIDGSAARVRQVHASEDWAAVLGQDGTLMLFGNYSKMGAPKVLQGVAEVAGGTDHLITRSPDGRIQVFGNLPLNARIQGRDRYETAAQLSRARFASSRYVVIATGENFPDALSAAPLARALNAPILLTRKAYLPHQVVMELKRLAPRFVYIVGGTGVISTSVEAQIAEALRHAPPTRKRIAGADRYETAVLIAREVARVTGKTTFKKAYIATGENFPDALSASPLAASETFPILLAKRNELPQSVKNFLATYKVEQCVVVGGTGSVSDSVLSRLPKPVRIAGRDRYETSVRLAEYALRNLSFDDGTLYLATGENFPDALAAGAVAGRERSILLLVPRLLPLKPATQEFLSRNRQIYRGYVAGGTGAVSQSVVDEVFRLTDSNWSGSYPAEVQGRVVAIASGKRHVLALTADGRVYAWGDNMYGQSSVPPALKSGTVQVACGAFHSLALKDNGSVHAWGANFAGQTDLLYVNTANTVKVAGGVAHTVLLKADGRVVVVGDIGYDHYGNLVEGANRRIPSVIQGKTVGVACGDYHTLAVTSDGFVYGWGDNKFGQAFGPWDYEPEPDARLRSVDATFTIEFNAPVVALSDRISFSRSDGLSIPVAVSVQGNKLFVKPTTALNENYTYYLNLSGGFAVPSEYAIGEVPPLFLAYSTWKLFEITGVSYNSSYRWTVYPTIKFFDEAVETTYALYRDSAPVLWTNGSPVSQPGSYLLRVFARSEGGEESEVLMNFRIESQ